MFYMFLFLLGCAAELGLDDSGFKSEDVVQCATIKGYQVCDFPAIDKNNESQKLSELFGEKIVIDLSAMWCGPCKTASANTQSTANILDDVTILTVLIENEYGQPPSAEDLARWAETYNIITEPVWGASREIVTNNPIDTKNKFFLEGWPTFYFIDSNGELVDYMRGYSETELIQKASALD